MAEKEKISKPTGADIGPPGMARRFEKSTEISSERDAPKKRKATARAALDVAEKARKRAPGGGRKKAIDGEPWKLFDPPISRSKWYQLGKPAAPLAKRD